MLYEVITHNADISVKSKVGDGAAFIIKFPLGKPKTEET